MSAVNESQTAGPETPGVHHNHEQNRFEIDVDGAALAHADYRREGDTLVFYRTYVPESARGQGHAAKLVRAGLEYARNGNYRVEPSCSYVARYIERHPEYQPLVNPA